jgi:hypothetical protein
MSGIAPTFNVKPPVPIGFALRRCPPAMEIVAPVCFDVRRSQDLAAMTACTESHLPEGFDLEVERMPAKRQTHRSPPQHQQHPQFRDTSFSATPAFRNTATPPFEASKRRPPTAATEVSATPPHQQHRSRSSLTTAHR